MSSMGTAALSVTLLTSIYCEVAEGPDNPEEQLWSPDEQTRETAEHAIIARRARMLSQCGQIVLTMAGNEGRKETVTTAIKLLGDLRSVEAVPVLVDNLTFRVDVWPGSPHRHLRRFPAAASLTQIGLPSLKPLLAKVQETDDDLVLTLAYLVVYEVLGREVGAAYVKEAVAGEKHPASRARLERLVRALENGDTPIRLRAVEE